MTLESLLENIALWSTTNENKYECDKVAYNIINNKWKDRCIRKAYRDYYWKCKIIYNNLIQK